MTRKLLWATSLLGIGIIHSLATIAPGQNEAPPTRDAHAADVDFAWSTLESVEKAIFENHIAPPVRQQMYMAATQAVYRANRQPTPRQLAVKFSESISAENFKACFQDAWGTASQTESFDANKTIQAAATAMLQCTGKNPSRFLSADEHRVANSLKENQYVGIGIQIGMHKDTPVIHKSFYGGAAYRAGAGAKDLIVEVNGVATKGVGLGEVINRLRGPEGSKLNVKIQQIGSDEVRDYEMTRTVIPIDSIEGTIRAENGQWKLRSKKYPEIAVLNFKSIVGSTSAELTQFARRIRQEKINKVLIDLRSVTKADLHHVVMLADALLDQVDLGTIASRDERRKVITREGSIFPDDIEIVVLNPTYVDGGVLMLLANFQNRSNVTFVGKPMVSSGLSTELIALPDNLGAIEALPNALCYSSLFSDNLITNPESNASFESSLRFRVKSDLGETASPEELFEIAFEKLEGVEPISH